jgi:hypothetical protein
MGEVVSFLLGKMKIERKRVQERLRREGLELEVPPDFDSNFEEFVREHETDLEKLLNLAKNTAEYIKDKDDGAQG